MEKNSGESKDIETAETDFVPEDIKEARMEEVARRYFILRQDGIEIAQSIGCSKSTVYNYINEYKNTYIKDIKDDLRANKKILFHMIGLMLQVDQRTRAIWEKYSQLEADSGALRTGLKDAYEMKRLNPEAKISNIGELAEAARTILAIHDRQQVYFSLLRQETREMLEIWHRFGLTGENALKLIMSDGIDAKVQEIKETIVRLVKIVREEVADERVRRNVFGRLAREIAKDVQPEIPTHL